MTDIIAQNYERVRTHGFEIIEHIPTLREYACKCHHVTELGVELVVSSWAFAMGLMGQQPARLVQVDIYKHSTVDHFVETANSVGIKTTFYHQSDLDCPLEDTDLLFIDTWHVYGQLRRELARWHSYAKQYIILHDTTVDEWLGESIRRGWDIPDQSKKTGIPELEIREGLWPAIVEFVVSHPEWIIEKRFTNCHGLTILKRIEPK